jgi:predicted nuclease of predicted toxin-antitoxin system
MLILANENIAGETVESLRCLGHDVAWMATTGTVGATDQEVLQRAVKEGRLVMTFDKDFGELAFREGLPATGVILLRVRAKRPVDADPDGRRGA